MVLGPGGRRKPPLPFFGLSRLPLHPILGPTSSSWVFLSSFTLNSSSSCRSFRRKSKRPWIFSWEQEKRMLPALLFLLRRAPLPAGFALLAGGMGREENTECAGREIPRAQLHPRDHQNPSPEKERRMPGSGRALLPSAPGPGKAQPGFTKPRSSLEALPAPGERRVLGPVTRSPPAG